MTAKPAAFAALVGATLVALSGTASAAWTATRTAGQGFAKATTMPTGRTPSAPATSTGPVTVTWNQAQLAGSDLATYTVRRYAGSTATTVVCATLTFSNHVASCSYTETTSGTYTYTDTPTAGLWNGTESAKSGNTVVTAAATFAVALSPAGAKTAGTAFNVTITAQAAGVIDATYTGNHTLVFSGAASSPSGQAPVYPTNPVAFSSGVATVSVTLYKAAATTLTVTETTPSRSGSTSVTVNAAGQDHLAFTVACPTTTPALAKSATWTSAVDLLDQWGNTTTQGSSAATVNVNNPVPANGAVSPQTVTVAAGASPARSGSFTYTASGAANKAATITASLAPFTAITCSVTT